MEELTLNKNTSTQTFEIPRDPLEEDQLKLVERFNQLMKDNIDDELFAQGIKYLIAELTFLMTEKEREELDEFLDDSEFSQALKIVSEIFRTRILGRQWRKRSSHYWMSGDAGIAARHWLLRTYSLIDPSMIDDYYHFCHHVLGILRNTKLPTPEEQPDDEPKPTPEEQPDDEPKPTPLGIIEKKLDEWEKDHFDYIPWILTNRAKLIVESVENPTDYFGALLGIREITAHAWRALRIAGIEVFKIYQAYMKREGEMNTAIMDGGPPLPPSY